MSTETYSQIRTWIDSIFKSNGRKFITGPHGNEGLKKVLAKTEELENSKGIALGLATLDEDGKVPTDQLPEAENSSGGSAYLLTLTTATYNADSSIKVLKQAYVSDPTKYYEQRFEYTAGLVTKIEIKDDLATKWVRHTNLYNGSNQLQAPTITDITAWTII